MRHIITATLLFALASACQTVGDDPELDLGEDLDDSPVDTTDVYATSSFIKPTRTMAGTNGLLLVGNDLWIAQAGAERVVIVNATTGAIKQVVSSEADNDLVELIAPDDFWRDPLTGDVYVAQVGQSLGGFVDRIAPNGTRTRILSNFMDGNSTPNGIAGVHRPGESVRVFIAPQNFFGDKTGIFEIDENGLLPPVLVYGAVGGIDIFGTGLRGGGNAMEFDTARNELFVPETFGSKVLAINVDAHTARTVWNGNGPNSEAASVRFTHDRSALLFGDHSGGKLLRLNPDGPATQTPQQVAQLNPVMDGIAVHPNGDIYTSNFATGGIAIVKPNGSVQQLYSLSMNLPNGLAVLPNGKLAVGDVASLSIVDPNANPNTLPDRPKRFIAGDITLGVAAANACDIYVTTFYRKNVQHFDLCAGVVNQATNITQPNLMLVPSELLLVGNTLYVADGVGTVWRLTVNGANPSLALPFALQLGLPSGLAHRNGKIYISEFNLNRINIFDSLLGLPVGAITNVDSPEGLAVASDGTVYVIESKPGRLIQIAPNGARTTLVTGLGTNFKSLPIPFANQYGDVAIDQNGDLIVTEPLTGAIRRVEL